MIKKHFFLLMPIRLNFDPYQKQKKISLKKYPLQSIHFPLKYQKLKIQFNITNPFEFLKNPQKNYHLLNNPLVPIYIQFHQLLKKSKER